MAIPICSLALLALQQGALQPAEASRYDRSVDIVLAGQDSLQEGRGPCEWIEHEIEFSGVLHLWTVAADGVDTMLRVEEATGRLLAEDDDSGGMPTPYVKLKVEPAQRLMIAVAASKPAEHCRVVLRLVASPESEATRAAAALAKDEIAKIQDLEKVHDFAAAERRAEDLIELLVGAEGSSYSDVLAEQAWVSGWALQRMELLHQAERVLRWLLQLRTRTLPDTHMDLQMARQLLAVVLGKTGDLREARALEEKEVEVLSHTLTDTDRSLIHRARQGLAVTLTQLGDVVTARSLFESVLDAYSGKLPDDHPDLQLARQGLADTLAQLGDLAGALALHQKVLASSSGRLPDDHPDLQSARSNVALSLSDLGEFAQALELEQKVLDVYSRTLPRDHPDLQQAWMNHAATLLSSGDLPGARAVLEKLHDEYSRTLPSDHPFLQETRENLADALRASGDLAGARALEEKVLEVRSRMLPGDHHYLQMTRKGLASTIALQCVAAGRAGDARAAEELRPQFVATVRDYIRGLREAALQAVVHASGREAEERVASRNAVGAALWLAGGCGGLLPPDPGLDEQVFLLSEDTRSVALLAARLARLAGRSPAWTEQQHRLIEASGRLATLARSGGTSEEFYLARTELDDTQRELTSLGNDMDPGIRSAMEADVATLSAWLDEGVALVSYRRYEPDRCVGILESPRAQLCAFVLRPGGRLTRVELGPMDPVEQAVEHWRASLGAGTTSSRGIGPGTAEGSGVEELGEKVRELVFDPLSEALAGARRIVVAPDDVLHLIPIDALPRRASGAETSTAPLLGDALEIRVLSSLLELLDPAPPPAANGGLLVIGDVDFRGHDGAGGESRPADASGVDGPPDREPRRSGILRQSSWERGFAPLPATRAEARTIVAILRESAGDEAHIELLDGERASRENLYALAPGARFLHVATHGWFAPESAPSSLDAGSPERESAYHARTELQQSVMGMSPMLLCGLALAGADAPSDECGRIPGLLTAEELASLDLSGCELAVLSACDTNVGLRRAGQGVASLQKALRMAGARCAITSLWKVPDEATKELMIEFYRNIWIEGMPKARALWSAKLKLRNRQVAGRPSHSFLDWAGWVLTGEPD